MTKYWDDLTEEEQYEEYLLECHDLNLPPMNFQDWKNN